VALYGTWIERLRSSPRRETFGGTVRRLVALLLVDMALVAGLVLGVAVFSERITAELVARTGLAGRAPALLVVAAAALLSVPFLLGILGVTRRLAGLLAQAAFPRQERGVDAAAAPRRALFLGLALAIVLIVGLPILAVTEPLIGGWLTAAVGLAVLTTLGVMFWRSTTDLEGHVRAGSQVVLELLAAQSAPSASANAYGWERLDELLPGLGTPVPVRLDAASPAVGRTLAELDLRGLTGATVLAIGRGAAGLSAPTAREKLAAGDVLALAGTEEAVAAAKAMLAAPAA
jgi:CPA2 family monovalent cation:H+ antiporter-2